jgi:SAM-dependent methyltransferase
MELFERVCSVCHSDNHFEVFDQPTETIVGIGDVGYHHKIQICKDCGFVFASPLLSKEKIASFYEKMSNYEHPQNDGLRPQAEKNQIFRYLKFINSRFPSEFKGKVLDIGCATAFGLSRLMAQGWDVLGLDPSSKCVALSKEHYGVKVIKSFFDKKLLEKEGPFDLIILCHVLEHLISPDEVVKELRGLLTDKGLIYIEVPNLCKPYAPKCYFCFEHTNFFTPTSLVNFLSVNGFSLDVLHTFDNGPEFSPFYPVISSTWKKSDSVFEINNNYQEALAVIEKFKKSSDELVEKLRKKIDRILEETPDRRLAVWGGGIHTSQLFSETSLGASRIACIFDNDSKKHGSFLMGHKIEKFSGQMEEIKKKVDAILISSEASENIIYDQISYLENCGIKVYKLYDK